MSDERREQIVAAAQQLVSEHGAGSLSVRNVAAKAGIGASTLRHYFPSQRELYDAVLGAAFNAQLNDLSIADSNIRASRRLAECMLQFLPKDERQVPELEAWFTIYTSAIGSGRTEHGAQLLAALEHHARTRVDTWLAILDAEGVLRHPDRRRHSTLLFALIDGLCLELLVPESPTTLSLARSVLSDAIGTAVTAPQ